LLGVLGETGGGEGMRRMEVSDKGRWGKAILIVFIHG
jgi:hypothetical protein